RWRLLLRPRVAGSELENAKAPDIVRERKHRGRRARHIVELWPIEGLDRALVEPVADSLSRNTRLDRELRTCARERQGAVSGRIGADGNPGRLSARAGACATRNRLPHVGLETGKQHVERAPAIAFLRKSRFTVGHRR